MRKKEKKWKKVKNHDSLYSFLAPCPLALGQFSLRSCMWKLLRKMKLIVVLNKTSPWAHTKSELDVLGIAGKLVEYVVHLSKRKKDKKKKEI
jgi:hypothetical protein